MVIEEGRKYKLRFNASPEQLHPAEKELYSEFIPCSMDRVADKVWVKFVGPMLLGSHDVLKLSELEKSPLVSEVVDYVPGYKVGRIVELKRECLGNIAGTKGVVYENYGEGGCSVIFENGAYDGFSPSDQRLCLKYAENSYSKLEKYQFTTVSKLVVDFKNGLFNESLGIK